MSKDLVSIQNFTPEQIDLITRTIAKGATPDELKLFLYRCQNLGFDPLKPGQIYFIKYGNSPGTIVVGIEGFRSRAARTGKLNGIKRGALKNDKGHLVGAWAEIYRSDWKECAREEVALSEYISDKPLWKKMPETMIKKVAEAAALRMAFPDDLGGIYTNEEMDQAEDRSHHIVPQQPEPEDGLQPQGYIFPAIAGRLAQKRPIDCKSEDLKTMVDVIDKKYIGKEIPPKTKEAYDAAIDEICKREGAIARESGCNPDDFDEFK